MYTLLWKPIETGKTEINQAKGVGSRENVMGRGNSMYKEPVVALGGDWKKACLDEEEKKRSVVQDEASCLGHNIAGPCQHIRDLCPTL